MRHPKVGFLVQQGLGFPILQIHVYMRVVVMILVARGEGLVLLGATVPKLKETEPYVYLGLHTPLNLRWTTRHFEAHSVGRWTKR